MGAYATVNQSEYIRNMKKNQEDVRDMVLDSYQDMQDIVKYAVIKRAL